MTETFVFPSITSPTFDVAEQDAAFFEKNLRSFVPPNAFDAHVHLHRARDIGESLPPLLAQGPEELSLEQFRGLTRHWMGDRAPTDGLFFALPRPAIDVEACNRFIHENVTQTPDSRELLLIRPNNDPAAAERFVDERHCAGFKVYHIFSPGRSSTFDAEIGEFLPEWAWRLAHERELAIMLHMVRPRAIADLANQQYIRSHCLEYPRARLILAHAARGFNGAHTVEGIGSLRGLDNVFFDTSVVCEAHPLEAILRTFGPTRLMYGSDFPISELRGRCVSLGDGFFWLYRDNADYAAQVANAHPTIVGIESLLALQQACHTLGLVDRDVEQIFCHTARELLGVSSRATHRTGQALYERARLVIPGATQLFGKRAENFAPERWPAYFAEARGCETVDLDGRKYIDMSTCGIGATLLGYADPDVTAAVCRRIHLGSMCTLNPPEEIELADLLLKIHPWAAMVRFGRTGGETMAIAVRIARARTRHDHVAICGYHGWHDWYLSANLDEDSLSGYHLMPGLEPAGVPRRLAGSTHAFNYNCIDELKAIVDRHGSDLAAIVMEPTRSQPPAAGFLEGVRELADRCGACLIMDEISIGWRLCLGGAHLKFGITPELAVFAKTTGGGHPIAAVIGTTDTMQAAQETFISSALWTEAVGPAAGVAAVRKMMRIDVPAHVEKIGSQLHLGLRRLASAHGIPLEINGHPAMSTFRFDHPDALALQTLWTIRMLDRGFLASSGFYPTLAHEPRHVQAFLTHTDEVFAELQLAIAAGDAVQRVGGPDRVKHAGFRRLA